MDVRLSRKLHKYNVQIDVATWRLRDAQKKVQSITELGIKLNAKKVSLETQINANQLAQGLNINQARIRANENPVGGQQQPVPNPMNNNANPNPPQIGNNVNNNANNANLPSNYQTPARSGSQQHRPRVNNLGEGQ